MSYQRIPTDSDNKDSHSNLEMQDVSAFQSHQVHQAPLLGAQQAFPAPHIIVPQAHAIITAPVLTPEQLKETLKNRRVNFDSQRYLSEGWTFAKYNCCSIIQIMLVLLAVAMVANITSFLLLRGIYGDDFGTMGWGNMTFNGTNEDTDSSRMTSFRFNSIPQDFGPSPSPSDPAVEVDDADDKEWGHNNAWLGLTIIGFIQRVFIYAPLTAGGFMTVFEAMRQNSKMKWQTLFSAFHCPYYKKLLVLTIMLSALESLGFHLFVLPGLYFSLISIFALPLHTEYRFLTAWGAIKHSYWVTRNHFCSLFCFLLMLICLNILGVLALGFGFLITAPVSCFAFCYCYAHLIGVTGVQIMVPVNSSSSSFPPAQPTPVAIPVSSPPSFPPQPFTMPPPQATAPGQPYYAYPVYAAPVTTPMAAPATASASPAGPPSHVVYMGTPNMPSATAPTQATQNYPPSLYPAQYVAQYPVIGRS